MVSMVKYSWNLLIDECISRSCALQPVTIPPENIETYAGMCSSYLAIFYVASFSIFSMQKICMFEYIYFSVVTQFSRIPTELWFNALEFTFYCHFYASPYPRNHNRMQTINSFHHTLTLEPSLEHWAPEQTFIAFLLMFLVPNVNKF